MRINAYQLAKYAVKITNIKLLMAHAPLPFPFAAAARSLSFCSSFLAFCALFFK